MSSKACRWVLVGSASIGTITVVPANTTVQQIAPAKRKADENDNYPDLEQVSLIAVRGRSAH